MVSLTQTESWKALEQQASTFSFQKPIHDFPPLTAANITLDFTSQRLDEKTYRCLLQLAHQCQLENTINALFSGELVNVSEKKPALHTALRMPAAASLIVKGKNIIPPIIETLHEMRSISEQIREGKWRGYTNKKITDIVNLGIGGSQLGPKFCLHALAQYACDALRYHFVSDIDPLDFSQTTKTLNPETTLFIVASKSFTTVETLFNLKNALAWLGHPEATRNQCIAITAYPDRAYEFGITRVLPIWEWVGGRYSLCSAVNLITCIAIGYENFIQMLQGACTMDEHFRRTHSSQNLPIHLALLGIWNNNFLKIHQLLVLTYGYSLNYFSEYVQQLDMESNGKSVDRQGSNVNYATGPIVWGGSGNQAQHSYYQLLCQGTHRIAADLISVNTNQEIPGSNLCRAQKEVLSNGFARADSNAPMTSNTAINHIKLCDSTAKSIGALIALYEHKIYIQSVIWNINAFDQPGVESSKILEQKYSMPA